MPRSPLPEVVTWLRGLPGLTSAGASGDGAVVGSSDRWIFELQPDGLRWMLAGKLPNGQTGGWQFDTVDDLERNRTSLERVAAHQAQRLSVCRLEPGRAYRVVRGFTDYHGGAFAAGQALTFRERHFLPYDGGHTIVFNEASVYLQEQDQGDILADLDHYLVRA